MTTAIKYFTPLEAQKTLPLVKQIVQDILDSTKEIRLIADDLDGKIDDSQAIKQLSKKVKGFINELEEIGCYYKDWNFTLGLVDFPAIIDGKDVFLCWRSDEERIMFYHELEAGYEGRKPIPKKYFEE